MSKSRLLSTAVFEIGRARLEIDAAELRVASGPDKGLRVELAADSLRIGSAPDCELVLHDPAVSARHALITVGRSGETVLRDLGSKNGILLGGWRVTEVPLGDRMNFRLGNTVLRISARGTRASLPLAAPGRFQGLVAHSVKMRAAVATLESLAQSDTTVLLEGETGSGKEVAAQALHGASPRRRGPFVVFDCGSVSPALAAGELFGHERGAFSGADSARPGLLEAADGGTLFCDEIGELPLEVQPLLLRAIEHKRVRRVGADGELDLDVRIIAATNRNLAEEVHGQRFRKDLYYRISVARVRLPPLRERADDIPVLAHEFAAELGASLSPELHTLLARYDWPGNVRELYNTVARLAVMPEQALELGGERRANDPLYAGSELRPLAEARRVAGDAFERRYLEEIILRAEGNLSRAAEIAGVSRQLISRLVAKHGLRVRDRVGE